MDGDRLVAVEDVAMPPDTPFEDIQAAVRGPEGEPVAITIQRPPGFEEYTFSILRENFPLPSVTWHIAPEDGRLGVIEINLIAASTVEETRRAIEDLQTQGATHFALDLRNNFGGLLDAGIDIARLFLKEGIVLQQQYRGRNVETFEVDTPGEFSQLPLVVLVNENTASAAEIIAGALQAQGRAQLIGTPTFGKDSIQLVFELQDGSSLHITSARWWFPDLEFPADTKGLQPDLTITGEIPGPDAAITLALAAFFGE
jgi:carboxyl-terminal processing protease